MALPPSILHTLLCLLLSVAAITCAPTSISSSSTAEKSGNHGERDATATRFRPRPFDESILPASQRGGRYLRGMGHVMVLDTYMSPKSADLLYTEFSIHTRNRVTCDIQFTPKLISSRSSSIEDLSHQTNQSTVGPECKKEQQQPINDHEKEDEQDENEDGEELERFEFDYSPLLNTGFDASKRTIVLVSGYRSIINETWELNSTLAWLQMEDVNVIRVSWAKCSYGIYSSVVARTPLVARQITIFLHYLAELSNSSLHDKDFLTNIHLVGHSLGAHIAGFVGQDLSGRVGRITGLDPAGPSFDQFKRSHRLDPTDAQLVDVIHTNAGKLRYANLFASASMDAIASLPALGRISDALGSKYTGEGDTAWFGIDQQVGHLDYYANNGRVQPGCRGLLHACDHVRATEIYAQIIQHEADLRSSFAKINAQQVTGTSEESLLKRSRLLAFVANDYESLKSGDNFKRRCGHLMELERHLTNKTAANLTSCTIPLDLVTPVVELKIELTREYGIKFDLNEAQPVASKQQQSETHYYFRTLAESPLLGDHYMLKVYLSKGGQEALATSWSSKECSLEARLKFDELAGNERILELEFGNLTSLLEPNDVLAIPFVHPRGFSSRLDLIKLLASIQSSNGGAAMASHLLAESSDPLSLDESRIERLFPSHISLSIERPKARSVFGSMKDLTAKILKFNGDDGPPCSLMISMIEIHPILIDEKHNLGALYTTSGRGLTADNIEGPIQIVTVEELETRRGLEMVELSQKKQLNVRVELESVLVGAGEICQQSVGANT